MKTVIKTGIKTGLYIALVASLASCSRELPTLRDATVPRQPLVESVSPSTGLAGRTIVQITGENFGTNAKVFFGPFEGMWAVGDDYSYSDTELWAIPPVGASNEVEISVVTDNGTAKWSSTFQIFDSEPEFYFVTPDKLSQSSQLTIQGSSFNSRDIDSRLVISAQEFMDFEVDSSSIRAKLEDIPSYSQIGHGWKYIKYNFTPYVDGGVTEVALPVYVMQEPEFLDQWGESIFPDPNSTYISSSSRGRMILTMAGYDAYKGLGPASYEDNTFSINGNPVEILLVQRNPEQAEQFLVTLQMPTLAEAGSYWLDFKSAGGETQIHFAIERENSLNPIMTLDSSPTTIDAPLTDWLAYHNSWHTMASLRKKNLVTDGTNNGYVGQVKSQNDDVYFNSSTVSDYVEVPLRLAPIPKYIRFAVLATYQIGMDGSQPIETIRFRLIPGYSGLDYMVLGSTYDPQNPPCLGQIQRPRIPENSTLPLALANGDIKLSLYPLPVEDVNYDEPIRGSVVAVLEDSYWQDIVEMEIPDLRAKLEAGTSCPNLPSILPMGPPDDRRALAASTFDSRSSRLFLLDKKEENEEVLLVDLKTSQEGQTYYPFQTVTFGRCLDAVNIQQMETIDGAIVVSGVSNGSVVCVYELEDSFTGGYLDYPQTQCPVPTMNGYNTTPNSMLISPNQNEAWFGYYSTGNWSGGHIPFVQGLTAVMLDSCQIEHPPVVFLPGSAAHRLQFVPNNDGVQLWAPTSLVDNNTGFTTYFSSPVPDTLKLFSYQ
ncbi:IPT/TIG domain-containing protein [Myxococcota bacterium]|nr:IPT/TIG domain-containing protein [Myxococcota bacterium]